MKTKKLLMGKKNTYRFFSHLIDLNQSKYKNINLGQGRLQG